MRIRLVLLLYVFAVCGADRRGLIDGLRRYETITETNCRLGAEQRLNVTYDGRKWKAEADLVVHLANTLTSIITAHPEIVDRTALKKKLPANESEQSAYEDTLWLYHFADDVVAQERVSGARICFGTGVYLDRSGNPYDDFCVYAKTLANGTTALSFLRYEYTKSEWYARARKTALDHLKQPFPWVTSEVAYLFYMGNRRIPISQSVTNETSPYLRYENSTWSRPYFDCGGTNRWIISNSIGFFGKSGPDRSTNDVNQKRYLGLVSIDINLSLVDLNQCDSDDDDDDDQFRGSHLCRRRISECHFISGRGFVRSSYACLCLAGYYLNMDYSAYRFADNNRSGINGSALETREVVANDYCLPCPAQCPDCRAPCVFYIATWVRYAVLGVSAVAIVAFALAVAYVIARRDKTLIATGNPPLLALMIVGAATVSVALCVRVGADETASACLTFRWIFHLGFALFYLSLVLHAIETVRAHRHKKRGNGNDADTSAPFANESRQKEYLTIMIIYAILCILLLSIWTWKSRPELRAISADNDVQVCVEDDVTFLYASYVFHAAVLFFAGLAAAVKVYGVPTNFIASRLTALCIASSFALGGVVLPVLVGALEKSAERNRYLALIAFLLHVTCDVPPVLLIGSRIYFVVRRKDDLDERQRQKSKPRHAVGLVGVFAKPSDSDKTRKVSGSGSTSTRMTAMSSPPSSTSDACADDASLPMTEIKELRTNRRRSADAASADAALARKHDSRRRKSWSTLAAHWLDWRRDSVDDGISAAAAAAAPTAIFEDIAENPTGEQMPEPIMGETNKVVPPRDDVFGEEIVV